jgi:hypothetical protein
VRGGDGPFLLSRHDRRRRLAHDARGARGCGPADAARPDEKPKPSIELLSIPGRVRQGDRVAGASRPAVNLSPEFVGFSAMLVSAPMFALLTDAVPVTLS